MEGIGPIVNVLGRMFSERQNSARLLTRVSLIIFLSIAFGRLIGNWGARAEELENYESSRSQSELKRSSEQQSNVTQVFPIIETTQPSSMAAFKKELPKSSILEKPDALSNFLHLKREKESAESVAPEAKGITVQHSQSEANARPKHPKPAAIPPSPMSPPLQELTQNSRQFNVDPSSLPEIQTPPANSSSEQGNVLPALSDIPSVTPATPTPFLIQNLKQLSPHKSVGVKGHTSHPSLRKHRRIPRRNSVGYLRKSKTSPQGKPANGFVFISSVFGKRPNPFGRGTEFHNGIDLVGAKGIPILATAEGRVVSRGRGRGYGIHVILDHGDGYQTLYAHLSKKRVKHNQLVKRGQIVGYLGSTGRSTGPHLHYSVYVNREAVDPKPYLFK